MKTPLIAVLLLGLSLPLGCTVEEDPPPDPLATVQGFCQAWAESACQPDVVKFCNAKSAEACQVTQSEFCRGIMPSNYTSQRAGDCLTAVKNAYADATLEGEEIPIVLRLAAPCDKLSKGTRTSGQSCDDDSECDTAGGFSCIRKLGATTGVCAEPEEAAAGDACDGPTLVCKAGYFCNGENCVAYKKTGGSCEGDYQCKLEDHCVKEADAETGTCELRADLNEACGQDADCQSGYCAEEVCVATIRLSQTDPLCKSLR
jgi:hypothetical protein